MSRIRILAAARAGLRHRSPSRTAAPRRAHRQGRGASGATELLVRLLDDPEEAEEAARALAVIAGTPAGKRVVFDSGAPAGLAGAAAAGGSGAQPAARAIGNLVDNELAAGGAAAEPLVHLLSHGSAPCAANRRPRQPLCEPGKRRGWRSRPGARARAAPLERVVRLPMVAAPAVAFLVLVRLGHGSHGDDLLANLRRVSPLT